MPRTLFPSPAGQGGLSTRLSVPGLGLRVAPACSEVGARAGPGRGCLGQQRGQLHTSLEIPWPEMEVSFCPWSLGWWRLGLGWLETASGHTKLKSSCQFLGKDLGLDLRSRPSLTSVPWGPNLPEPSKVSAMQASTHRASVPFPVPSHSPNALWPSLELPLKAPPFPALLTHTPDRDGFPPQ